MMRNNYRYSRGAARLRARTTTCRFLYASSASVYGGGSVFREERDVRGAAQRLRLLEVPVRPARAPRRCRSAPRRSPASATSTSTGRASTHKGRMASVALHFFDQYRADGRVRLFEGSRRLRRRRAAARLRFASTTSSRRTSWFLDHPDASGIFNLGTGPRGDVQRDGRRDDQRRRRGARASRSATSRELVQAGVDRLHPVPAGARRQVPELHRGRPRRAARGGLRGAVRSTSKTACRATSNG